MSMFSTPTCVQMAFVLNSNYPHIAYKPMTGTWACGKRHSRKQGYRTNLEGWLRGRCYGAAEGVQVDNDKVDGLDLVSLRGVGGSKGAGEVMRVQMSRVQNQWNFRDQSIPSILLALAT